MNHADKAISRILWQYRNSPKFTQWLRILPDIAQVEIENPLEQIINILDIDTQSGDQLDIIGRIVGAKREYFTEYNDTVYQFGGVDEQFGGTNIQFSPTSDTVDQVVSDAIYRILIKAKIAKNNSIATIDSIADTIKLIVNAPSVTVNDNMNMTFSITFNSVITDIERFVLTNFDAVPRPQGVRFVGFTETPTVTQFGGSFAKFGDTRAQFGYLYGA